MHTTDLSAEASAKAEAHLTPQQRLRELACIFASGFLRLKTCPKTPPDEAAPRPQVTPPESSEISPESPCRCATGRP